MVALKVYFDDSGEEEDAQHRACAVAGYVGDNDAWDKAQALWNAALTKHGVPYLHMKEFAHHAGPFAKFRNDEPARVQFLSDLIDVVRQAGLTGIASITRLADLRRFNGERGLKVQAYAFNLYTNMVQLSARWPDAKIEVVIDRTTNHGPKAAKAREYADSDAYYQDCGKNIRLIPLDRNFTAKDVPALQIADFLAWEARKDIDTKDEWFANFKKGDDLDEWMRSLREWSAARGQVFPYSRKSVSVLFEAREVDGVVWDYRGICTVDNARKGIWP
jgi:hypothetical protein